MIESLNGIYETVNYKQKTSIKLYDNDKCEDYPPHWHMTMEIIMPIENIYTLEYDHHSYVLREGDIVLICPCSVHALFAPPIGRRIIFQPDISALRFMKEMDAVLNIISPFFIITPEEYPVIHGNVKELLLEIRDEYMDESLAFSEVMIYSKFLKIIALIGRNYAKAPEGELPMEMKRKEYMEKFFEICDYIDDHCTEDLNLEEVAAMCGYSKYHFSRLFKQFTNVSFYKYLSQKRIAKAAELLADPEQTISDVALSSGFSSHSSFIRMFKLIKGCTPTEFREMQNP